MHKKVLLGNLKSQYLTVRHTHVDEDNIKTDVNDLVLAVGTCS
jgi:hypothetical protein